MTRLTHIHHVQLAMPEGGEAEARGFYGIALGLTEVPKPDALADRRGVWFESGAVRVHLGIDEHFQPARKAHPAFLVDDLDTLRRRLADLGHETRDAKPLDGVTRCHVSDPFGNRVELMEEIKDRASKAVDWEDEQGRKLSRAGGDT